MAKKSKSGDAPKTPFTTAGRKVDILPAAVNSFALNEFIAVKYGAPKGKPFTAEKVNGIRTIYFKDRTIYIGRGNSITLGLLQTSVDNFFLTSPLSNPATLKTQGVNYMMVTPERLASSEYVRRNGLVGLFSDSGGFQLSKGVTDFIDPEDLTQFYKAKVDYGIGLDVPLPLHLQHTDWFLRMCRVQIANNKYIAKGLKGSGAELYDVSHGLTLENRKRFLTHVLDNKAGDGLALGGIGQSNYDTLHKSTLMAVLNLSYVVDASKGVYEKFHVLGTTSPFMVSIYHLMTKLGIAPYITADSSTYAQGALAFHTRGIAYSSEKFTAMYKLEDKRVGYGLACNCPLCSMVGHPQAYRMSQSGNSFHNLHVLNKLYAIVEDYVDALVKGEPVMEDLLGVVSSNSSLHPLYRALYQFVFDLDKGFNKALKIHQEAFRSSFRKDFGSRGLFKGVETIPAALKKAEANVTKAIERYEQFHGLKPLNSKGAKK